MPKSKDFFSREMIISIPIVIETLKTYILGHKEGNEKLHKSQLHTDQLHTSQIHTVQLHTRQLHSEQLHTRQLQQVASLYEAF